MKKKKEKMVKNSKLNFEWVGSERKKERGWGLIWERRESRGGR